LIELLSDYWWVPLALGLVVGLASIIFPFVRRGRR